MLQDSPFPNPSRGGKPPPSTSSYPTVAFKPKSNTKEELSAPLADPKAGFSFKHICFTPDPIHKATLDRRCLQTGDVVAGGMRMPSPWWEFAYSGPSQQQCWALRSSRHMKPSSNCTDRLLTFMYWERVVNS